MRKLFFLLLSIWLSGPSSAQTSYMMSFDPGDFTIDASGWRGGVYAVRGVSSDGIRTAKIHVK